MQAPFKTIDKCGEVAGALIYERMAIREGDNKKVRDSKGNGRG